MNKLFLSDDEILYLEVILRRYQEPVVTSNGEILKLSKDILDKLEDVALD